MKRMMLSLAVVVLFFIGGCGSDLASGILIGAGTSGALTEGQKLAEQSKTALIEKILVLEQQIEESTDPNEVAVLTKKLETYEKQKEIAEITTTVTNTASEGLQRDWSTTDPQKQEENYEWIATTGGAVLLWLLQKRRNRALEKGIARVTGESEPEKAKEIYDTIKSYTNKVIA